VINSYVNDNGSQVGGGGGGCNFSVCMAVEVNVAMWPDTCIQEMCGSNLSGLATILTEVFLDAFYYDVL